MAGTILFSNLTKPISMKKITCLFAKSYNTNVRRIIVKNFQATLRNVKILIRKKRLITRQSHPYSSCF